MKKTIYLRQSLMRHNLISIFFYTAVSACASWPRLLIEVFIRKNFGVRHFTLASSITVFVILFLIPGWYVIINSAYQTFSWGGFFLNYGTWYLYLFAFMYFSIERGKEIKHAPNVFDFKKFSIYSGDFHPFFKKLGTQPNGKVNLRKTETLIEPMPFFVAGILLWLIGQPLGILLVICSFIYGYSYEAEYRLGDHFIMNKIDEIISNEELERSFVQDLGPEETRGYRFYGDKPANEGLRKKIAAVIADDEIVDAK